MGSRIPLTLSILVLSACGSEEAAAPASPSTPAASAPTSDLSVPESLPPIADPEEKVTDLEWVEDLSEEVANQLIEWGDQLRKRAYSSAEGFLAEDFLGHDLAIPGEVTTTTHPLQVETRRHDVSAPPVRNRIGFLAALREFLSPFTSIDLVLPKLKGAEFSAQGDVWGALTIRLKVLGRGAAGSPLGKTAWLRARIEKRKGRWLLTRVVATSSDEIRRPSPLFTDVARSAGIAMRGPRFGTEGNKSFFWNGASAFDADQDGDFDLFVPSDERNFLYRNDGDGTFRDVAEEAGVAFPGGGTGAVFFDADNDGDSDLFVSHVGIPEAGDDGSPCQFYRNEGEGTFVNASKASGLGQFHVAFSASVADVNNDGWLDLYVCGYNSQGFVGPNSWHDATNATPNALYLNQGDGTFRNVAEQAGVADRRWSYAGSFSDFDRDGDQDLYVANDYGKNALFVNDGTGKFDNQAEALGVTDIGNGMGCTWGDYDRDGDLDLYVANMSSTAGKRILKRMFAASEDATERTLFKLAAGNTLFNWNGKTFDRVPLEFGGVGASWAWSTQFLDFDLDGDGDLVCANGFISGQSLKDT